MAAVQWCNLTPVWWFWATKVCWRSSKITKICVFGCPTWWVTFWKANSENYSRYYLIKWYQFLSISYSMSNTSFRFMPHHAWVSCLIIRLTINAITLTITVKGWCWRLLIYAIRNFLLHNNVTMFSEATTTVLESFTKSTWKDLCWSLFFHWNDEII